MGHKNKLSLLQQMTAAYQSKLKIGESKHLHKIKGDETDWIFSWSTYKSYTRHAAYFLTWAKQTYNCKTLQQARQYADEWLQTRIDAGLSAYTIKLELAALCKLYGDTAADYIPTPPRLRKNITRSRGKVARDAHFSEAKNEAFCLFARCTGLRRAEMKALTCEKLCHADTLSQGDKLGQGEDYQWYIHVNKMSKGGRPRYAPIIGTPDEVDFVVNMMKRAGNGRVWDKVPQCDIHNFRSEYATAIYLKHCRPVKSLPKEERYCCRKDRKGTWFDRRAMGYASAALGHSFGRCSVVGEHYLRI